MPKKQVTREWCVGVWVCGWSGGGVSGGVSNVHISRYLDFLIKLNT